MIRHRVRGALVSLGVVAALAGCGARNKGLVDTTLPDGTPLAAKTPAELLDDAVGSADPAVRALALSARVASAAGGDALARWVIQGSHDPDPWVQRAVARALARRLAEPAAVELLGEYVSRASGDPYVRLEAGEALRNAGHQDVLQPLVGSWTRQPAWRAAPLALLATWAGDGDAPAMLTAAVASGEVRDDRSFVVALGRSGLLELDPALAEASERLEELAPRFAFARVLLGADAGVAAWAAAQRSEFASARDTIELLLELPPSERAAWAKRVVVIDDPAARAALGMVRHPSADRLRRAMSDESPWVRHLAVELGALLDAGHAEPLATVGLGDDFDEVQVGAAALAGQFDLESLRPTLVAMLVDDHLVLRTAAAGALLRMDAAP
jgi:HEAT repeat protein